MVYSRADASIYSLCGCCKKSKRFMKKLAGRARGTKAGTERSGRYFSWRVASLISEFVVKSWLSDSSRFFS